MLMADPGTDILTYAGRASVIIFLLVSIYGFYKQWWVIGWQYRDLEKRYDARGEKLDKAVDNADAWKEQALTGARLARQTTSIAAEAVKRGAQVSDQGRERGR